MKPSRSTLSNGLKVLVTPIKNIESATLTVWVNVGSRYEDEPKAGISHFLEHIVFKGGKKYTSAKKISEAIDSMGAEFNASTGKEITLFYVKARADKIEMAFDILSDMLLSPLLKPSDIEREKGVIKAEMDMYEDLPIRRVEEFLENIVFEGNSLARDIIGTKKAIDGISAKDFKNYLEKHYFSQNMLITLSGSIESAEALRLSEKYFGSIKNGVKNPPVRFVSSQKAPKIKVVNKKTDQAHIMLGFLGERLGHKNRYAEAVLNAILGGGMSSRMFTEIREKRGLAYAVRTYADHYTDTGRFTVYAGVEPNKAEGALKIMLKVFEDLKNEKINITAKELAKAKEYIKGKISLALEDTSAINQFFGEEELLLGKTKSLEEVFENIDKVKKEELLQVANGFFTKERLSLAIIGPFKNKAGFDKIISN